TGLASASSTSSSMLTGPGIIRNSRSSMALPSSCQNFTRDAVAGLDRTLHSARPDAIIGVLAREEHSPVERCRDQRQHRVALVADRRTYHRPRPDRKSTRL